MNKESRNGFDTGYVVDYHMVQFPADFIQLCGKGRFPQILVDYSIFGFFCCGKKARCRLEITLQRKVSLFTCFICITIDCRWEVEMLRFEAPSESVMSECPRQTQTLSKTTAGRVMYAGFQTKAHRISVDKSLITSQILVHCILLSR